MLQRLNEGSRSLAVVDQRFANTVAMPFYLRVGGGLSSRIGTDRDASHIEQKCADTSNLAFVSRQSCAAVAIRDGELRIRKDLRVVYDGYMPAGTLCYMSATKIVSFEFSRPMSMIVTHLDEKLVADHLSHRIKTGARKLRNLNDFNIRSNECLELCHSLRDAPPDEVKRLTNEIFQTALSVGVDATRAQKLPWWRLRKVKEYVAGNISGKNSLPELADVAGLSRMHFAAQFKAATCLSPHEFVLRERAKAASRMLSNSDTPIIEIALSVGFQNQAHFSTVFKSIVGSTPAGYRRTISEVLDGESLVSSHSLNTQR